MAEPFNKLNLIAKRFKNGRIGLMKAAAAQAITFSKQRFREQAWADNRTEPWKKRMPGAPREKGRRVLIDSGRLKNSIRRTRVAPDYAVIGTDVPYAKIHNEGGTLKPRVTDKMRGFAWKMHYATKDPKWKGLALTKKTHLTIKIKRRKFLGHSHIMNTQIKRVMILKINKMIR